MHIIFCFVSLFLVNQMHASAPGGGQTYESQWQRDVAQKAAKERAEQEEAFAALREKQRAEFKPHEAYKEFPVQDGWEKLSDFCYRTLKGEIRQGRRSQASEGRIVFIQESKKDIELKSGEIYLEDDRDKLRFSAHFANREPIRFVSNPARQILKKWDEQLTSKPLRTIQANTVTLSTEHPDILWLSEQLQHGQEKEIYQRFLPALEEQAREEYVDDIAKKISMSHRGNIRQLKDTIRQRPDMPKRFLPSWIFQPAPREVTSDWSIPCVGYPQGPRVFYQNLPIAIKDSEQILHEKMPQANVHEDGRIIIEDGGRVVSQHSQFAAAALVAVAHSASASLRGNSSPRPAASQDQTASSSSK